MPQILLRHHWSRESMFFSSVAVRDHVLLLYKKIDKMQAFYSLSFKSKGCLPTLDLKIFLTERDIRMAMVQ